jgi:AAA15 family ATPase/GTPase
MMGVTDMLIGFSFGNYMSFFGENTFTMRASADKKFNELNTTKTKYGELIKSAFVLGANGSGKSNFIRAIDYMKDIVLAELSLQSRMIAHVDNFLFSEVSNDTPSVFEVEFITDEIVYEYGFELLNSEVNKEYLYKKTRRKTPVFIRTSPDFKDISLSKDMDNVKELAKNTRRDTLFLYWANGGNNEIAMAVCRWFENMQIFETEDISRLLSATIEYLEENKEGKSNVLDLLQRADINMLDFDIELSEENEQNKFMSKVLKKSFAEKMLPLRTVSLITKHYFYNEIWEKAGTVSTPVLFESAGTRKLFEIAGPIIKALENGNVVFIDEIDTRLHPMLVRFLVMMFNSISKNPKNAQLICNTHDVLLLDEDIRRDQVYFTEKDEYGVSRLYSLTDFKGVRKESKLLRQYLLGFFGATPRLQDYFTVKKN